MVVVALPAAVLLLPPACAGGTSIDPCAEVDCSQRGFCIAQSGRAFCACLPGYHPSGLVCVVNDPAAPCAGVDCTGYGACRVVGADPVCDCEAGYEHLGGN
jgi:hypothetical protein